MKNKSGNTYKFNLVFLLSFNLFLYELSAQVNTANVFKMKVFDKSVSAYIEGDSVLYTDHLNRLKINFTEENHIGLVKLHGGKIWKKGTYYYATVKEGLEAVLSVFARDFNGKLKLSALKKFKIVHLKAPELYVGEVKRDSIIKRSTLLRINTLHAKLKRFNKNYNLKVESFELNYYHDTSLVTLKSVGNQFSLPMRRYINSIKPGVPLYISNIFCRMPNGDRRKLNDVVFYLELKE